MDYLKDVYSGLHKFLMLNTATLSGAVDIIVIQHPVTASIDHNINNDVETAEQPKEDVKQKSSYFTSTPFHLRFGKKNLLFPSENIVKIKINNKPVDLKMKIGPEGVAYFDQPSKEDLLSENMDSARHASQPINSSEKIRVHSRAFSDGVLMGNSSVVATNEVKQIMQSDAPTVRAIASKEDADVGALPQLKLRSVERSLSASASPIQTPLAQRPSVDTIGDVIWWWGNPEPRPSVRASRKLRRVESVLGSWAREDSIDDESKAQLENLTKEIEALDSALTISGMEVGGSTTTQKKENDKDEDAQVRSWGLFNWFKSNNKEEGKEDTASVRERIEIEELEELKRKGDLLKAAQRRESEMHQNARNVKPTTEDDNTINKESQSDLMRNSSSTNGDEISTNNINQNHVLPAYSSHLAMSSPSRVPWSKENSLGQDCPEDLCLEELRSMVDNQTLNENNTESLVESVDEMSTATLEDKDCQTATDIEDFNFNDLAKELQPGVWGKVKISLCGHRLGRSMVHNKNVFQAHLVSWETLCENPSLVFDDRMVIMTNQRLYPGRVALPLILSTLAFEKPLSGETLAILAMNDPLQKLFSANPEEKTEDNADGKTKGYTEEKIEVADQWQIHDEKKSPVLSSENIVKGGLDASSNFNDVHPESINSSIVSSLQNHSEEKPVIEEARDPTNVNTATLVSGKFSNDPSGAPQQDSGNNAGDTDLPNLEDSQSYSWLSTLWSREDLKRKSKKRKRNPLVNQEATSHGQVNPKSPPGGKKVKKSPGKVRKRLIKTLQPTSAMLQCLNLTPGENQIEFIVNSGIQGQQSVKASIWLWRSDDKIVVSDVDGTITKSDVMGHCMPWVGNSWCHDGVARYFSDIEANGYRIMYLTSRSIGHAAITREYLFNEVGQDGQLGNLEFLPGGPVIMAPDSLFTAVNRELIQRNPQQFKIPALQNVKDLFPKGYQPYAAAFGNRKTDLIAYHSVDIPIDRIFIIDTSGAMRTANRDYNITYPILDTIVDVMFPPSKCLPAYTECNDLIHWKQEYIADLDDLSSLSECEDH